MSNVIEWIIKFAFYLYGMALSFYGLVLLLSKLIKWQNKKKRKGTYLFIKGILEKEIIEEYELIRQCVNKIDFDVKELNDFKSLLEQQLLQMDYTDLNKEQVRTLLLEIFFKINGFKK